MRTRIPLSEAKSSLLLFLSLTLSVPVSGWQVDRLTPLISEWEKGTIHRVISQNFFFSSQSWIRLKGLSSEMEGGLKLVSTINWYRSPFQQWTAQSKIFVYFKGRCHMIVDFFFFLKLLRLVPLEIPTYTYRTMHWIKYRSTYACLFRIVKLKETLQIFCILLIT